MTIAPTFEYGTVILETDRRKLDEGRPRLNPPACLPSATMETLRARSDLMQKTRAFFLEREFLEVDTPVLSTDTVVDRYIDPIAVDVTTAGRSRRLFLQTSPEFAMKRLLAGGARSIFQLGRAFRGGESGRLHQPEFAMLEWYRVGDSYENGRSILDDFVQALLGTGPATQLRYRDAFLQFAKIDPFLATDAELIELLDSRPLDGTADLGDGGTPPPDRDGLLNLILSQIVEPALSNVESIILYDWPASQAALARVRNAEPPVAERFEIYVQGIELANGYHELADPDELLERNRQVNRLRRSDERSELPADSQLIEAMRSGFPDCCGTALGFDRLVMLALGKRDIREVVAFDFERA